MYLYRIYIMNISSNVIYMPNSVNKLNLKLVYNLNAISCMYTIA
jgi:hypothetical protein